MLEVEEDDSNKVEVIGKEDVICAEAIVVAFVELAEARLFKFCEEF